MGAGLHTPPLADRKDVPGAFLTAPDSHPHHQRAGRASCSRLGPAHHRHGRRSSGFWLGGAWGYPSLLLGSEPILAEVIGSSGSDEYLEAVASGADDGSVSEPLRKRLGANLRAERHRRALTQEALAEHLGVTARYLAGIERGERNLTLDSVDALASRLDLDALGLLTGRPQRP